MEVRLFRSRFMLGLSL
ncbi:hypothetical protein Golax_009062 [Gossypium laxum]|uniref:Uncharacterized protein n=2 Tax=Gossypium TaxID=3633 RepID=A0A7J8XZ63_GOSAI|nr:hypothetical protein [Gossypium aridum]MBA0721529.1 hypothetical protein [Gossypium laxum]